MTLDPDLMKRLQEMEGAPPIPSLPVATVRAGLRRRYAALTRPAMQAVEDLAIDGGAGRIALRLYRPSADADLPIILFIHGGGFVIGDLETHDPLCRCLAAATGTLVVAVDYALAPEHPFPAGLEDCLTALHWLRENAGALGGDPATLAIAGDSAGANLALACTRRLRATGAAVPTAQLLAYPVAAMPDPARGSYRTRGEGWGLTAATMEWFWRHYMPDRALAGHADAAPLYATDLHRLPPTWLLTAEFDPLRDEGIALAGQLARAGVALTHHHAPTANHGFLAWGDTVPLSGRVIRTAARWLGEVQAAEG